MNKTYSRSASEHALEARENAFREATAIAHFGGDKRIAAALQRAGERLPPGPPIEPAVMEELFAGLPTEPQPTDLVEEIVVTQEVSDVLHAAHMASIEIIPDPQIAALQAQLDMTVAALERVRDIEKPMCGDHPETDWLAWYTTASQMEEFATEAITVIEREGS